MKYSDFDSAKKRQSFRPTPYTIDRTSSQSNTVSFQSSCPVHLDEKIGQFSSVLVADDNDDLASQITDDMKKAFRAAYRKHGTLKDRRKLNIKYHHIGCQRCLDKNNICVIRPSAFQCGNCPPYMKCTRVPTLNKLRVLDVMNITEEQYDWLLTWYKETAEEEFLEPLKESFKLTSTNVTSTATKSMSSPKRHSALTSVVPLDLSRPYEIENFTNIQFEKIDDSISNSQADDVGRGELSYGHFVTNQRSSKSIIPIPVESSSASYFQSEELPMNKNFTAIGPCYTPALLYGSTSPRVTASTTLYRTPDSIYQEFSESPYSVSLAQSPLEVNSVEHIPTIWGRHNDPHTYAASTESTQLTTIYKENATYMSSHQNCADEFGRCGRTTINASDYLHCGAYAESETGNIHRSLPDNTLLGFAKGIAER